MKLYFSKLDESYCYTLPTIKALMDDAGIDELEIIEARRVTGVEFFYCKRWQDIGIVSESCGKINCDEYVPNNGKSGRCKHYGYCYEMTDKKRIIKIKS